MDNEVKKELIARGVPALGVPVLRMVVNNHYEQKRIERQEEMAVKVAQQRSEGLRNTFGQSAAPTSPTRASSGDIYQDIDDLRSDVSCSFCQSILTNLMEAPPEDAKAGYREMVEYADAMQQQGGLSEDEIGRIVESWETVPEYAEM